MTLLILALALIATLSVALLAEKRDVIRAWIDRTPVDLDRADGCARPGCNVRHQR
ncbi:MAG: hypothetical protein ACTHQ3_16010 [Motilibacteraceae bacterium]